MEWTIGPLDYFFGLFFRSFFWTTFWTIYCFLFLDHFFLDHFIGGHTISTQGRVGYSLSVLREG